MEALINKIETLIDNSEYDEACDLLVNEFDFKLNIISSEFKSMDWDKDGQKRNVFKCQLVRNDKSYNFEFGTSVVDSCDYVSEYETLDAKKDKIEFYAGLKSDKISVGNKFQLTLKQVENLSSDFIYDEANALQADFEEQVKKYNENVNKKFAKEYARSAGLYVDVTKDNGMFVQCVQKAVKRKLDELKEKQVLSKTKQLSTAPIEPSLYDVISCLQKYEVGTFEDFCSDFGYDEDSRQAEKTYNAVVKEYEGLSNLFTDEELNVLSYIN